MGKKDKSNLALTEDFKELITMIPKLEAFIKVHNEIAMGYQKYRKNGGDPISGIEKHLGIKCQAETAPIKAKAETKTPKEGDDAKKSKKKKNI